jgi:hypothetical protein
MLLQILFFHPETLQKDERSRSKFRCITVGVWEQGMINSYDVLFGKFFIVFKNTHFSYSVIYSDGVIEFLFRDHLV